MKYPNLWAMLFNAPLVVEASVAQQFANTFLQIEERGSAVANAIAAAAQPPQPHAFADNVQPGHRFRGKAYTVTESGIAVLPVHGALVQRAGQIGTDCMELTSYQRLGTTFRAMMADPDVRGILMEMDSPGGQVAGNFELAGEIMKARDKKPIWAHANVIAFSGGYSLMSAAERAYAPRDGMVGSIGVIMQHVNVAEKDRKAGIEYTTIKAGAMKDMFDPHKPLSKAGLDWAQASVDRARDDFAALVAAGRKMDIKAVMDTEAGIFHAPDGKALGLIDDIATFSETLAAFEQRLNAGPAFVFQTAGSAAAQLSPTHPMETDMSGTAPAAAPANPANPQPAAPAAAPAAPAAPAAAAPAPAASPDAATAERTRIQGIVGSDEAKGRDALAQHLAFNTTMSVEDAKKALAASPVAGTTNPLAAAMSTVANPKVGVDAGTGGEPAKVSINTADIYARRAEAASAARAR